MHLNICIEVVDLGLYKYLYMHYVDSYIKLVRQKILPLTARQDIEMLLIDVIKHLNIKIVLPGVLVLPTPFLKQENKGNIKIL